MQGRAGPKAAVDNTALSLPNRRKRSASFADFARKYVPVKTKAGPKPLKPREWQIDLVGRVFDCKVQPRLAGWMLPRGNGKTTLVAAIALWELFCGQYAAEVVICATDERTAGLLLATAKWMVENSPDLIARAQIFSDKIVVPGRSASLRTLPATEKYIQGLDATLLILDEAGFSDNDVFGSLLDSQGKRESSTLLLIGTPGIDDSPLERTRAAALK